MIPDALNPNWSTTTHHRSFDYIMIESLFLFYFIFYFIFFKLKASNHFELDSGHPLEAATLMNDGLYFTGHNDKFSPLRDFST